MGVGGLGGYLFSFFIFGCVNYIICRPLCIFFVLLSRQKYQKRLLIFCSDYATLHSAKSRRGYFYCPPQFLLCVTLTTTTYLGCRVQPTFDDKTSRFDVFLEKCGCNNTIDVFCYVEFIPLVIREFIPHRIMRGVKPPRRKRGSQRRFEALSYSLHIAQILTTA